MTAPALDEFRGTVRQWCEQNVPKNWREEQGDASDATLIDFQRRWGETLREAGYLVPHWPIEWGGPGFDLQHQVVLYEELTRADCPRLALYQVSIFNAAPAILQVGTEKQKQRFLPGILNGEVWCQGFSEPGAGSDLAALQTRAVRDGDNYIVNGQKIWTSWAAHADWCILLVRTDPDAPKRHGISYLLLDMRSPGIEVRRIKQSTGGDEFCETFLTDVVVPAENLLGEENKGWQVAQSTLSSERGPVILEQAERMRRNGLEALITAAADWTDDDGRPVLADDGVRDRLAALHSEVRILRLLCNRMIDSLVKHGGVGAEASIIKLFYSELLQKLMREAVELRGLPVHLAQPWSMSAGWESGSWLLDFIGSWSWTIAGGSNEIQRNIIGEQMLGLRENPEHRGRSCERRE